jgi:hypothetical protein
MGMFRRGGLPPEVYTSLGPLVGGKPNVLAWASTPLGYAVALDDRLVWTSAGHWDQIAWHEILHGGWNPDESELHWTTVDGDEQRLSLTDAGSMPGVFRERVEATILFRRAFQPTQGTREVTITARRTLGTETTITWGWTAAPGGKLTPTALDEVEREVGRLATEYDVS